jgi:hypothetical protein
VGLENAVVSLSRHWRGERVEVEDLADDPSRIDGATKVARHDDVKVERRQLGGRLVGPASSLSGEAPRVVVALNASRPIPGALAVAYHHQ